ncbi:cbb3-type cytochrome oxidase assembly protein CcoS (plasmid) [Pedobacter sp. BS3]|uniref:cbb3-type cytochrome oxidase assembly protein CcoS n=1 Tax=Pedobacter sp. BS3 TaxID=2567937 RepID=UPI0011ED4086|nr:cbb3-type cytochrome oxidase assembly protein CcoS [Pedobacter sp. BS3]TZF85634.1 cbb3-type cytochrome oxidase assembly protein CcoS [Pedobacter sp. BS3]
MTIIYFLIGCSIVMALIFLGAFFWSLKNGQHDDMHTPAIRMLFDDDSPEDEEDEA